MDVCFVQALGFFRQPEAQTDFTPVLHIKNLLKSKKIVGVFAQTKNKERMIKTIAGVIKMAIDGKPAVVVPMAIRGSDTPIPPTKIGIKIGKPVGPMKRMKRETRYELATDIYEMIKELKKQIYQME